MLIFSSWLGTAQTTENTNVSNDFGDCSPQSEFFEDFESTEAEEIPDCFQILKTNSPSENADVSVLEISNAVSGDRVFEIYNGDITNGEYYLIYRMLITV